MWHRLRSLAAALRRRTDFENGLADELRFHVDEYTADLVRSGLPPAEAARRARLEFGNADAVARDCREARGLALLDTLQQDVRQGLRLVRRTPTITATALATVAVCIGANLALFAVVDAVLLRPLPFTEGDRLVRVFNTYPLAGVPDDGISLTNYYERRGGQVHAFAQVAAWRETAAIVGEPGSTAREHVTFVSPEFFATLGVSPAMGRAFRESETAFGSNDVAIVTDAYWRQVLGAAPDVIGRRLRVEGFDKNIVGVLPPGFAFLSSTSRVYMPLASAPEQRGPDRRHWGSQAQMIARLAPGISIAEAQAQIDAHNASVEHGSRDAQAMAAAGFRSMVVPLRADHVAQVRPVLLVVQAGALFLLGIGTVNLVNLLLIRAAGREKEFAVRQAIGAHPRHVLSELVVETLITTVPGGLLGVALGAAGIRLLAGLGAERLPLGATVAFDGRLALAGLVASVVVGLVVSLPVAWHNLRAHAAAGLHSQSRTTTASRGAQRLRHAFLVTQVALAFVLLAGAGLLALSLQKVAALPAGFRAESVLSARVTLPGRNYPDTAVRLALAERVIAGLAGQPGVRTAGFATNVPLSDDAVKSAATVIGYVPRPGEGPHAIYSYGVGGDYFGALGVPLREGRFLVESDSRRPARVCVVDEAFARRHFAGSHAIGQRLFMGGQAGPEDEAFTIVGVVGAVKQASLTDDAGIGAVFYPYAYRDEGDFFVVARTGVPPLSLAAALLRVVHAADPEVAVADVRTMEGRVDDSLLVRRSPALLAVIFALVALLLTAVGTYGVLGHAVAQRRREIGVRMALGARPAQVRVQFLGIALRLVAAGAVAGLAGAWATGRAMGALLFDVPAVHVPTLAASGLVVAVVTLAACLVPSDRAARVSPTEALADE